MQVTLRRKIVYVVVLLVLAFLLFRIGDPARIIAEQGGDIRSAPGGVLAQYRTKEGLSQAQIGEIDPASSTIKLATFGMRGIALSLLWYQAEEKKKRHEWSDVVAVANQIIFLEPHFIPVWDFLSWTLAYNASADFDDYRERYRWVIRGFEFVLMGLEKNRRSTKLYEKAGWTMSQKIGMADEVEQYRRLLKNDDDFGQRNDCPLPSDRDNWLLGRRWYHQGEALVRDGISLRNQSDFIYFANSRLNLFNYAKWLRRDGTFGEPAMKAWNDALVEWIDFGRMELATAIPGDGTYTVTQENVHTVKRAKLETVDVLREEAKELLDELHALAPGLHKELCITRWQQLGEVAGQQGSMIYTLKIAAGLDAQYYPVEELLLIRQWLDENEPDWQTRLTVERDSLYPEDVAELRKKPRLFLSDDDKAALDKTDGEVGQVHSRAMEMLRVPPRALRDEIQELDISYEDKSRAREIVEILESHNVLAQSSKTFRSIINYETRFRETAVESHPLADEAHRLRHVARNAYYDGRLTDSLNGWLDAMKKWDELLYLEDFLHEKYLGTQKYKDMANDVEFVRDRIDIVEKFLIILDEDNKIFSDVSDDPVPLHRMMWYRAVHEGWAVDAAFAALDYAKNEYEKALAETDAVKRKEGLEKAEWYFLLVALEFNSINAQEQFMEFAPFFELRDRIIETVAYLIMSRAQQGKPLPEPLPLRSYVETMLAHDPALRSAKETLISAEPLIRDEKYEEALPVLEEAVQAWAAILDKYPIVTHDPTNPVHGDVILLAEQYVRVLRAQEKPVPDGFPLKTFLR